MSMTKQTTDRNQSIECCKLIASFFVIFIHVVFPGRMGQVMDCLARFAVPFFFMVSGYFSFQADERKIAKRISHVLKLNLAATLVYLIWECWKRIFLARQDIQGYLLESFSVKTIANWLIMNVNPFSSHLWYLTAIGFCYMILWVYVCFQKNSRIRYQPLYIVSVCLLAFQIIFGVNAIAVGLNWSFVIYRNTLFFGLPMFSLGIFIHEYQERIISNFNLTARKLILLIVGGALLSLMQWFGIGKVEMPVATITEVIALMLLLVSHPFIAPQSGFLNRIITNFGAMSTFIYIMHPLFYSLYNHFCAEYVMAHIGGLEGYLKPLLILVISFAASIVYAALISRSKRA